MNRYIAAFALLLSASDVELGLVKPKPVPAVDAGNASETPNSSPDIGAAVGSAIEAAVPKSRPVVIYTQTGCAPCLALEQQLAAGIPGAEISYSYDLPGWCESTPAIYLRDVRRVAYGYHSRQQFIDLLERNKPVLIPQAVSVGKIAIRSHVANILSRVEPGGTIRMGSAQITLPQTMQPQVKLSRESLVVTFTGQKPSFKYGQGWLAVGAPINGFTLTDSLLTVSVAGLPDVSLQVE